MQEEIPQRCKPGNASLSGGGLTTASGRGREVGPDTRLRGLFEEPRLAVYVGVPFSASPEARSQIIKKLEKSLVNKSLAQ